MVEHEHFIFFAFHFIMIFTVFVQIDKRRIDFKHFLMNSRWIFMKIHLINLRFSIIVHPAKRQTNDEANQTNADPQKNWRYFLLSNWFFNATECFPVGQSSFFQRHLTVLLFYILHFNRKWTDLQKYRFYSF